VMTPASSTYRSAITLYSCNVTARLQPPNATFLFNFNSSLPPPSGVTAIRPKSCASCWLRYSRRPHRHQLRRWLQEARTMAARWPTRLWLWDTATCLWHLRELATPQLEQRCPTAATMKAAGVVATSSRATATLRQGHTLPERGRHTKGTMPSRLHPMAAPTIQPTMTEENRETG
jgi:hypothetical protein